MQTMFLEQAIREIMIACNEKKINESFENTSNYPFVFVVGAGISAPEVKTASEIIEECKKKCQGFYDDIIEDEKELKPSEEYSFWFEKAFPHKESRRNYIKNFIINKKISAANLKLAHVLLSKKVSNLVITPNFDDFICKALNIFGYNDCLICDHPSTIAKIDPLKKNIQIVHVHGTYQFYDCCNLTYEIKGVAEKEGFFSIKKFINQVFTTYSPMVIGYSGWEDDVIMTCLKERLKAPLPYKLYWFCYKEETIESLPTWLKDSSDVVFVIPKKKKINIIKEESIENENEFLDRDERVKFNKDTKIKISDEIYDNKEQMESQLDAYDVLSKMIEMFKMDSPQLLKNPIKFYLDYYKKVLPTIKNEDKTKNEYFFNDFLIEPLEKTERYYEELLEKQENTDRLLNKIKQAVSMSSMQNIIDLISGSKDEIFNQKQLEELLDITFSLINKEGESDNLMIKFYDVYIKLYEKLSNMTTSENKLIENYISVKISKAKKISAKDKAESIRLYSEIIENYNHNNNKKIIELVLFSKISKAQLINNKTESLEILNELIEKYKNYEDENINKIVVQAMIAKARVLENSKEELKIIDDIIEYSKNSQDKFLKSVYVNAVINKATLLKDEQEELKILDELIHKYEEDKDDIIKFMVLVAMLNKVSVLNGSQKKLEKLDDIINKYKNYKENNIQRIVIRAMLSKSFILEGTEEKFKILDDIIDKYKDNEDNDIQRVVGRAMLSKSVILEDTEENLKILNDIIDKWEDNKDNDIQGIVGRAMLSKSFLLESTEEKLKILDNTIDKYKDNEDLDIQGIVARVMLSKSFTLEDTEEELKILDNIISKYEYNEDDGIQDIVARSMLSKSFILQDTEEKLKILDKIIDKYEYNEDNDIQGIVARAMLSKSFILEGTEEELKILDNIIYKYKNIQHKDIELVILKTMILKTMRNQDGILKSTEKKLEELDEITNRYEKINIEEIKEDISSIYLQKGNIYYQYDKVNAAKNFYQSYLCDKNHGVNLAYMIRRKEIDGENFPNIKTLLDESLKKNDELALINYALCYIYGIEVEKNWIFANRLISKIENPSQDIQWWYELDDEIEKNLVIALLVLNGLIKDPEEKDLKERFEFLKDKGIEIPDYLFLNECASDSTKDI